MPVARKWRICGFAREEDSPPPDLDSLPLGVVYSYAPAGLPVPMFIYTHVRPTTTTTTSTTPLGPFKLAAVWSKSELMRFESWRPRRLPPLPDAKHAASQPDVSLIRTAG